MARTQLRVYYGPSETTETTSHAQQGVSVPLDEVLPVLADAMRSDRSWLRDFAGEEITISTDLYEVILAYQHFRRPSA